VTSRIVLFGATGYTGELTARALVRRGQSPILAGRNVDKLSSLAQELGGLEYQLADATRPESMGVLVRKGDVLISTVGPFMEWGEPALQAAVGAGAHYLDSTGEPPFIQDVFEKWNRRARAAESALLPAMGYDYVPGNLAAALALRDAGPTATKVEIGYFVGGAADRSALSSGTMASLTGVLLEQGFVRRGGVVVNERPGLRERTFDLGDGERERAGRSIGGSEHFSVAQSYPTLQDVEVFLGWFIPTSRAVSVLSRTASGVATLTPVRGITKVLTRRLARGAAGGPDAEARAAISSVVVAETFDAQGQELTRVVLSGVNPYDFTGDLLAWAADRLINVGSRGVGALGPVAAFGLDELAAGARRSGLEWTA
jgi:short subunit dehydrogenase-like uncharacterized protein